VYHANGQRKDTRTVIQKTQLPKTIIDDIFKKRRNAQLGDAVRIEIPQAVKDIFRVKTTEGNTSHFIFYDADGKEVNYDY
jgi:ribosomal protein L21E